MSRKLSRRAAVATIAAAAPVVARAATTCADAELIELGRQFNEIIAAIDRDCCLSDQFFNRLAVVEPAIVNTPATSIEGLRVKARAACWALLGDLDPTGEDSTNRRMALSIVRDLIRLYDPQLEHPDALKKLVEDLG